MVTCMENETKNEAEMKWRRPTPSIIGEVQTQAGISAMPSSAMYMKGDLKRSIDS